MSMTTNSTDLGPRGYKIIRKAISSSYDPADGIEWTPGKETDELFDALRRAFPSRKTHRERMCEALMQYLAEELEASEEPTSSRRDEPLLKSNPKPLDEFTSSQQSFPRAQKVHVNSEPPSKKSETDLPPTKPITTIKDGAKKSGKNWQDMTVVWKSNIGLTKGARPRRMMTADERTDYRMRRVRGACVACKRKKRKCNHDPDPSPTASSETIDSLPLTPPLRPQRNSIVPVPATMKTNQPLLASILDTGRSMDGQTLSVQNRSLTTEDHFVTTAPTAMLKSSTGGQSVNEFENHPQFESTESDLAHEDGGLLPPNALFTQADLSRSSSKMPELGPSFDMLSTEALSSDMLYSSFPLDSWIINDVANAGGCVDLNSLDSTFLDFSAPMVSQAPNMLQQFSYGSAVIHDPSHDYDHYVKQAGRPAPRPRIDQSWEQVHAQAHVEHWLNQKISEQSTVSPDLEVDLNDDKVIDKNEDHGGASSQKRRVKFDFSTLIDGPPTLSSQAAEDACEGRSEEAPVARPPRSTSRHSTASRMSFSDIISLSSALTTLSMKDAESRRGSIHSAGSERLALDDSDDEGAQMASVDRGGESGSQSRDSASEDDGESVNWAQFNMKENQALLASKDELFERYIRVDMPSPRQKS